MKGATVLTCLILIFFATVAWGDSTAWEAVWQSEDASSRVSLTGQANTMAVTDGRQLSATAAVSVGGGKVRFDYRARGRSWSLIDDGLYLMRLQPTLKKALLLERPRLAVDRELAERNYVAREVASGVVAGRDAKMVEIAPRSGGPVVFRLWLDGETGFALKHERYNVEGRMTSATEYSRVTFGVKIAPDVFAVPKGWVKEESVRSDEALSVERLSFRLGFMVRRPRYIPEEYRLMGTYEKRWGRRRLRAAELRYTDGLRVLSVFQHPHREDWSRGPRREERGRGGGGRGRDHGGLGMGPPRPGEMTLVDRGTDKVVRYFGRDMAVFVIGDMLSDELVRIARSVE